MSQFIIRHYDKNRTKIIHVLNDEEILTDRPPEYGGEGRSFSCTDLVASALGSCFISSAVPIMTRDGIDPSSIEVELGKRLGQEPKQIFAIQLVMKSDSVLSEGLQKKLRNALSTCPVRRSLSSDIKISLSFIFQDG